MGGKGGGGNDEPGWMPTWRAEQEKIAKAKADQDAIDAANKAAADKAAKEQAAADKAAAAAADKAAKDADKAASDKAASDKAAADKLALETPLGPSIQAGGAITQPTAAGNPTLGGAGAGDALGGAVLDPPKYWVGGTDSFKSPSTRKSSLRTTL
jgi:membrane protein involved in colicin uptake